ncbi:MAG: UDP-N-acetylglucosamine--N-acetylmuramyl-(pentapeptide) pyrophosphoryl-undecaprenol N-acetylglucosamine transferase [Waddliaceae bacterium]|nr:UDP-N-acetylglucosamine--N-acetylmuramyl-(pentapeptide) pyrophosphoryl-undecaprenol N-acetylglucosamine transferase [Waddliaceae bacterium]
MKKKVLIASGGTGGHVIPAQALASQLQAIEDECELLFVGGGLKGNAFFDKSEYLYRDVHCASLASRKMRDIFNASWDIWKGIRESRQIIKEFQPDLVVGFGSYHSLPVLTAARWAQVPIVLLEGNAVPGKVVRMFSKSARVTGLAIPSAASQMKGKTIEVNMPLREGYTLSWTSKESARSHYYLDPDKFTFLIFGGSQGAKAINHLTVAAFTKYLNTQKRNFQLIHLVGDSATQKALQNAYDDHGIIARVKAYEHEMDRAWMAADLVISRAGAAAIAEQIEMEVPGILIPYPHATDSHQDLNADFMTNQVGAAVKVQEKDLNPELLANLIRQLISDDQVRLQQMREAVQTYKRSERRRDFCSVVCEVAGIKIR